MRSVSDVRSERELLDYISTRVQKLADETFDEETAIDSDGTDQAERDGMLQALAIVEDAFRLRGVERNA